jgi:hypothetical protein
MSQGRPAATCTSPAVRRGACPPGVLRLVRRPRPSRTPARVGRGKGSGGVEPQQVHQAERAGQWSVVNQADRSHDRTSCSSFRRRYSRRGARIASYAGRHLRAWSIRREYSTCSSTRELAQWAKCAGAATAWVRLTLQSLPSSRSQPLQLLRRLAVVMRHMPQVAAACSCGNSHSCPGPEQLAFESLRSLSLARGRL